MATRKTPIKRVKPTTEGDNSKPGVRMSTPWAADYKCEFPTNEAIMADPEALSDFIDKRNKLHTLYIQEEARTKRLWLILSVSSMLIALLIITFAPSGREVLSYWIGGGLLIFSAGGAGYKRVWAKVPGSALGGNQDKTDKKVTS